MRLSPERNDMPDQRYRASGRGDALEHEMTTETLIKVQDTDRINDSRKAELLANPVEHIDITTFDRAGASAP